MNSFWTEFRALLAKEWRSESRSLTGFSVTALFALVGGVTAGVALYSLAPEPVLLAGIIWIVLLFAGSVMLPRTFLLEEESGTIDLLRLLAPPAPVFWAKAVIASAQMLVVAFIAVSTILVQAQAPVPQPLLLISGVALGAISVATTATLCGAIASGAQNRANIAPAIAIPLMTFLASLGTAALLPALGDPRPAGYLAHVGLLGYAAGNLVLGPPLLAAVWKR